MLTLTWPQVLAFWAQRHFLEGRASREDLLPVVSRVCGLHAQVMSSAELAAWARIDGMKPDDVSTALWQDRTLVKVWAMRWTLHLFTAGDYPLYVGGFDAYRHYESQRWLASMGITTDDMNALLEGYRATLTADGLTREQLADAIARHSGKPHLRAMVLGSWGTMLKPAAFQGHMIFGPSSGQNVTFISPRHWLGDFPTFGRDEAFLEIVRRYLTAYGPATSNDFAAWWGSSRAHARKLFRALGGELIPVSVDGWDAWALAADADALQVTQPSQTVRLLPGFDPYTLGLRRVTQAALPVAYKGRVFRPQGWISALVLVGGRVVGVWKHEAKKAQITITVSPFEPISQHVRAGIEQEAVRLGPYFDAEPVVTFAD